MSKKPDPLEVHRLRLEQAEREAKGDFSQPSPPLTLEEPAPDRAAIEAALAKKKADEAWAKAERAEEDADLSPNAILNAQHNNLRAQAKIDQAILGYLDTSLPRQDR